MALHGVGSRATIGITACLLLLTLLTGCASRPPRHANRSSNRPAARLAPSEASGVASYCAAKFDGRKTANGETFSNRRLTAAHRTLPFGTVLRVTNLDNGRSVTVRVNDRGPFVRGRVVDLSCAAAAKLDMVRAGTAHVSLRVVNGGASFASID